MPNRIIKESICTSEKLANLNDFEFRLWISLILLADDYGCGDARPAIIKGRAFPLRERLANKDVENSLVKLAAGGCVNLYEVDGKPYYQFPNWSQHQRIRNAKPKYPQFAASCRELRPESNPIQYESESNPNPESELARGGGDDRPDFNTVEVYAANNLAALNAGNMAEFVAFKDELPEELIRHAIDEACAAGKRTWSYTRAILTRYRDSGFKTVGEAKAAKPAPKSAAAPQFNYAQRKSGETDYSSADPTKDLE